MEKAERTEKMDRPLTLALAQMCPVQGEPEENRKKMEAMIREAAGKGADLICFPELSYTGYFVRKERLLEIAEPEDGPFVRWVRRISAECRIAVAAGFAERGEDGLYNSCILTDRTGALLGTARKMHLWKSEKKRFLPGREIPVFETEWGKTALILCYDLEFPEPARVAALRGASLILCPAAWSIPARNRWDTDLAANSLFNRLFLAGVNYGDSLCCGASAVVSPDGAFLLRAPESGEGVFTITVDLAEAEDARTTLPYLEELDSRAVRLLLEAAEERKI